ncbi:intradiol ring-cleavage dioxygenase [Ampullimonas aquatilis]|uniref:intradiol ring-cleavage dioxygenase n=1 Tax=Ampullimonas aquatilis TaxID=1341549 RepID=UPI003C783273
MHAHDQGLAHDLNIILQREAKRRQLLRWLSVGGAVGTLPLIGCGGGMSVSTSSDASLSAATSSNSSSSSSSTSSSGSCSTIPEETAGPYPGDGSNSNSSGLVNVLALSGIVRNDIRASFGAAGSNIASGIPLTVTLQLININASCASLEGYAIYLWHCNQYGQYSLYSSGVITENYLRGVQVTDSYGKVTFTTIFPGCYSGRWPHIHFEIYPSLAKATSAANKIKTSQLALPKTVCDTVYASSGYSASVTNLANISLTTDNIFSDGYTQQLATVSGDNSNGYTATLQVGIAV